MPFAARPALLLLLLCACSDHGAAEPAANSRPARFIALVPQVGDSKLDRDIGAMQTRIEAASEEVLPGLFDRLGRLFIQKARTTHDTGYYKLTQSCADAIDSYANGSADAMLLRGHCLHSMHKFPEAEKLARKLVATRGDFADHGLLGDVLIDRGDVDGALDAYQAMLNVKPCLQAYARAAHARWICGDTDGARQLIGLAAAAGSARDPESLAWTLARRATIELSAGSLEDASDACSAALAVLPGYAPALLARGRIQLARGEAVDAITSLEAAAKANPLPEYRWLLADALRATGDEARAQIVEAQLEHDGAIEDPRTYALYLASRGKSVATAVDLIERELEQRRDVHTLDALAWTQCAAGDVTTASSVIREALAIGTPDSRLHYHAGVIAMQRGDMTKAKAHFATAEERQNSLYPSERDDLRTRRKSL